MTEVFELEVGCEVVISRIRFEPFSAGWPVWIVFLINFGALTACSTPMPPKTLVLNVTNDLGRTITEVRKKPCGDLEIAFVSIEGSRLAPGETRGVALPSTCVDLVAFDSRGRIVGEQRGLTMRSGARWLLRR